MRTQSASVVDRSAGLMPPVVCNHPDDVAEVHVVGGYRIAVRFHDGTAGVVDLSRLINSPAAGVFAELREPDAFSAVEVYLGAVTWPSGIDLAPDSIYDALRVSGEWVPE
jgi:hypothetical protein